jgi:hypothetical protein
VAGPSVDEFSRNEAITDMQGTSELAHDGLVGPLNGREAGFLECFEPGKGDTAYFVQGRRLFAWYLVTAGHTSLAVESARVETRTAL